MTRRYAEGTTVSVENSRAELERLLRRYGAKRIHNYQDVENGYAAVQFEMRDRLLRFIVEVPTIATFRLDRQGYLRTDMQQRRAWEQEERRRWRVLILSIKAKLEEVESETAPFDTVFMPYIVLPNNQTVADVVLPGIDLAYATGDMPSLLPDFAPRNLALPPPSS